MALTRAIFVVLLLCLTFEYEIAHAKLWIVGDEAGWDYNVSPWPLNKDIKPKDQLLFQYDPRDHDVAVVPEAYYEACKIERNQSAIFYRTGNDTITLASGGNFFISSMLDDCQNGIQMAVYT
ncbi:chemocyanin-like [Aristolochia californica]|uniref:chemocyanin-like n=1 Tax=Aristolochia californica TaxID=171875 RepID=UPI0035D8BA3C